MQVMLWVILPNLVVKGGDTTWIMNYMLLTFLIQYVPKVLRFIFIAWRLQHVTGYIFGSASWGFVLNLAVYFCAAHVRLHVTIPFDFTILMQIISSAVKLSLNLDNTGCGINMVPPHSTTSWELYLPAVQRHDQLSGELIHGLPEPHFLWRSTLKRYKPTGLGWRSCIRLPMPQRRSPFTHRQLQLRDLFARSANCPRHPYSYKPNRTPSLLGYNDNEVWNFQIPLSKHYCISAL